MKKIIVALGAVLWLAALAIAADIGKIPWTESNLQALRSADKNEIANFINPWSEGEVSQDLRPFILDFKWMDLAGDGRLELLVVDSSRCCTSLVIYKRGDSGRITASVFQGAGMLDESVRDLNGDGKYELILYSYLKSDGYQGTTPVAMWPQVYRLEGGKYVEASRDFPDFYDKEILPELDKEICNPPPGHDVAIF